MPKIDKSSLMLVIFTLIVSCGCIIGASLMIKYVNETYTICTIEKILDKNCWEQPGKRQCRYIFMDQYVQLNKNKTGFVKCGVVRSCEISSCGIAIHVNKTYECMLYKDNLYMIGYTSRGLYLIISVLFIMSVLFPIFIAWVSFPVPFGIIKKEYHKTESESETEMQKIIELNIQ